MIHIYYLLIENYAQSACYIGHIFLGIGLLKLTFETSPSMILGFNTRYSNTRSDFEYNYNYYKHLLPHGIVGWVAGTHIGIGIAGLIKG